MFTEGDIRLSPGGVGYRALDLAGPWADGERTPVVFQHGLGLDGRAWAPWIRRLADDRPIVSIDMRGHGASTAMWRPPSHDVAEYAGDVLDVLDHLGVGRCHFVGESFGGTVGLWLGVQAPERFASIAVASTAWRGAYVNNVADWPGLLAAAGGLERWTETIIDGSFDAAEDDPAMIAWARSAHLAVAPEVVAALVTSIRAVDLGPDLERLRMPILNLVAGRSPFVDAAQHDELQRRAADCIRVDFPKAKHRLFMARADNCVDAWIARFGEADG